MRRRNRTRRGESEGMLDLFGGKKRGPQVSSVLDGPPTVRELKSHSKKYFWPKMETKLSGSAELGFVDGAGSWTGLGVFGRRQAKKNATATRPWRRVDR